MCKFQFVFPPDDASDESSDSAAERVSPGPLGGKAASASHSYEALSLCNCARQWPEHVFVCPFAVRVVALAAVALW